MRNGSYKKLRIKRAKKIAQNTVFKFSQNAVLKLLFLDSLLISVFSFVTDLPLVWQCHFQNHRFQMIVRQFVQPAWQFLIFCDDRDVF